MGYGRSARVVSCICSRGAFHLCERPLVVGEWEPRLEAAHGRIYKCGRWIGWTRETSLGARIWHVICEVLQAIAVVVIGDPVLLVLYCLGYL